jgi:hypothetical protein
MKVKLKAVSIFLVVLSFFCLSLAFQGCSSSNSTSPGYSELLFWSDGSTIHTGSVNGSTRTSLGSATIPGIPGTYTRTGTLVTVTMPNHNLPQSGFWVDLVFSAGTGGTATSGNYQVTIVDANTFTVNDSASGTITGGAVLRKPAITLDATYSQSGTTTITITLANHNLKANNIVQLHFTSGTAVDAAIKIASVVDANTFTVTAASAATTSGDVQVTVGGNYTIFSIAMHPNGRWVYTTSTYDCAKGDPFCWGSGLISRFAVNWYTGALTFEESTVTGVTTNSAPVTANFSPDGTLLFNQDDDLDGLQMWNVNATDGTLTLAASSANDVTFMHGVCVSSDGTRVYNGNNVFSFTSSSITRIYAGSGGESNVIIGSTLYSADYASIWEIRTFSLSNPDVPSVIATASTNTLNQAREIAVSSDGKRIVSAGWGGIKSYDYNGTSITPAVGAGDTQYIDGGGLSWPTYSSGNPSVTTKMFRSVNLNNAGNMIATAYFTMEHSRLMGLPPSGVMLFNLAADGSLSLANDYSDATYARVAKFFTRPY